MSPTSKGTKGKGAHNRVVRRKAAHSAADDMAAGPSGTDNVTKKRRNCEIAVAFMKLEKWL